jgi:alkaline phosphatase D
MLEWSLVVRVVHVSDSHLSPEAPYADAHWLSVVDYVARSAPDLVVHTGDISLNGAGRLADLEQAHRQLDRLDAPWLAIPGNHDIGDIGPVAAPVTPERRARYQSVFGDGFWSTRTGGWHLIGLDIQTMAGDEHDAEPWWHWLGAELQPGQGPTAVFTHRPLRPLSPGEVDSPHRYLTEPARTRLERLLDRADGMAHVAVGDHFASPYDH